MKHNSLSKLFLLHNLIGQAVCFHPALGLSIKELSSGFYTELQNDFGTPLNGKEAEFLWLESKEFHWHIMKKRPTDFFPFLVCSSQPDSSTYDHLRSVSKILERATSNCGQLVTYFNPYSSNSMTYERGFYTSSVTEVAVEPIITRANSSCFLTSVSYNAAILAEKDSDSKFLSFNPLTSSMKIIRGTIETLKAVLAGSYSDIPIPKLVLERCPHMTNGFTANVLTKNIATYFQQSNSASPIAYVTKSSFFHKMVSNKEKTALPDRFTFWYDILENGVENDLTRHCKSFLERIFIRKGDDINSFKLGVNLLEASDTETNCFWSMIAGIGEMSSICRIQIHFPNENEAFN